MHRRHFLRGAVAAAGISGLVGSRKAATAEAETEADREPETGPKTAVAIRLGGPLSVPEDPEEMALAFRKVGYRAAYCPNVSLNDRARIDALAAAFAKHDVVIAEVGRWSNLLDADPEKRKANLAAVAEGLALADAIGARCCVNIAGSFNEKIWYGPHPDNLSRRFFDAAVENARKIVDAVKPKRSKFCYEMMGWALPDSPDSYLKMIEAVDRDGFGVHLDPCNLVNSPERFYRNAAIIDECFDKLGRWIASCHAKDLAWEVEMNVHFREVCPGTGSIDYATFLRRLSRLPHAPPLMLEHLSSAEEYDQARRYILEFGAKLGLAF